jgi:hypothetical protein
MVTLACHSCAAQSSESTTNTALAQPAAAEPAAARTTPAARTNGTGDNGTDTTRASASGAGVAGTDAPGTAARRLAISGGVTIRIAAPASDSATHAAAYLKSELHRQFGIESTVGDAPPPPTSPVVEVILAEMGGTDPVITDASEGPALGLDGYVLTISAERRQAVLMGGGGNGLIRGVFALAQLTTTQPGEASWPQTALRDTPEMEIRITREILSDRAVPKGMDREQFARYQLDWWARWGLNHTFLPASATKSQSAQEQFAKWYLHEGHDRGMKVGANLGGRSLCASDEVGMARYLSDARRLLGLGCDFLVILFDDLPSTRTAGHCERCVKQFGGSLAREQRHILESVQKLVDESGADRKLIWCPTYYSLGMTGYRDAAEGPEAYFSVLGESPAVRKAWMYHCAFDGTFNAYLDAKGLRRRIWWYNGIRTPYYMVSRTFDGYEGWGKRMVIPGVKEFQGFFPPFENGWLMPSFRPADESQHPCVSPLVVATRDADGRTVIPPASWDELRQLAKRSDGVYFCGDRMPYHIAMAGLFGAHPSTFDAEAAAKTVMTVMFGEEGCKFAKQWEDAYERAQMLLARAEGQSVSEQSLHTAEALTVTMSKLESQLRTCVDTKPSALHRDIVDSVIEEMAAWRERTSICVAEASASHSGR